MDFKECHALNDVAQFHRTFGLPVLEEPLVPSKERIRLRLSLLEEELKELREALDEDDIIETADALCDLQYVLSGAILEFGLGEKFKALFDEVHRSNMSKTCNSIEEAEATRQHYLRTKGVDSHIVEKESAYLVYRTEDGKVLKSINYSPADLKQILKG